MQRCAQRASSVAATSGRLRALQRTRESAAQLDARALLRDLRVHTKDAIIAEGAVKALVRAVLWHKARTFEGLLDTADFADTLLQALRTHGANVRMAQSMLNLLEVLVVHTGASAFDSDPAAHLSLAIIKTVQQHCDDADVLSSGCNVLSFMSSGARALDEKYWSADVNCLAIEVLSSALRANLDRADRVANVLFALTRTFSNPNGVGVGFSSGCVELVTAALRTHQGKTQCDIKVHQHGCEAIGKLCSGRDIARIDACAAIEAVLQSLRSYPDSKQVQSCGLRTLIEYRMGGGVLERDSLGFQSFEAALLGLCNFSQCPLVARQAIAVFGTFFEYPGTDQVEPASWLVEVLREPEALALLKSSLRELERAGQSDPLIATFVHWIIHGACAGCGKLQEAKMKLCARCKRAPYCSEACQNSHWPAHKLECALRPAADAAGSADAA